MESGRHRGPLAMVLVLLAGAVSPARGGIADTPLPTFGDGKAAQLAALVPGVIKDNNVETVVMCTNLTAAAVDVGLEVFDETGSLRNEVATGNGVMLQVGVGATVTFGTGPVAVLFADQTLTLNTAGSGTNNLRNGAGRVVASGVPLGCVALLVDRQHTIADPAICPTCQPPSLATLPVVAACPPGACDDGNPCTADGCDASGSCTHRATSNGTPCDDGNVCTTGDSCRFGVCSGRATGNGTPCDDGNVCTTGDSCGSGVCSGTQVVCSADTPCDQVGVCEPATGQCGMTAPISTCIPGGGKPATDCVAEWVVDNPGNRKGRNNGVQLCRQGDRSCDFDIDLRRCTFHVRVCLNAHDLNLSGCVPGAVTSYELKSPSPHSANGATLLHAVSALAPSTPGGKRRNRVVFAPPDGTPDSCTPAVPVQVAVGKPLVIKVRATSATGTRDKDRLRLKCVRR